MTDVWRMTTLWTGFPGAPGYTRFSFMDLNTTSNLDAAGAATRAFFQALVSNLPDTARLNVQQVVQVYDMATGVLLRDETMTSAPAEVVGIAGASPYAAPAGAAVTWHTGTIFLGSRITGRTYLVPLVGIFQNDGSLTPTAISTIQTAANNLIAAPNAKFSIWGKRFNTATPPQQTGGALAEVSSATIRDKVAVLRSRRD